MFNLSGVKFLCGGCCRSGFVTWLESHMMIIGFVRYVQDEIDMHDMQYVPDGHFVHDQL